MKTTKSLILMSLAMVCLSSCGSTVPACDHTYRFVGAKAATCLEDGIATHYECTLCGAYFANGSREKVSLEDLKIPALGHTFRDSKILVKQTCKEDGLMLQKCIRCDETQEVKIDKYPDHVFDQQKMEDKYLKSTGDCNTKDVYYLSCGCGESSYNHTNTTFEGNEHHDLTKHEAREPEGARPGNSEYYTCNLCEKIFTFDDNGILHQESEVPIFQGPIKLKRLNGAVLDIVDKRVEEYLKVVDDPTTENNEVAEYIYNNQGYMTSCAVNKNVTLAWTTTSEAKAPFTLTVYKDEAMTKVAYEVQTTSTSYTFRNMIPSTYYYQVTDSAPTKNYSILDSFSFNSHVRAIDTKNNIKNMRDLGGWKCEGGTIKYGKLYRSANWDSCANYGNEILTELGMKSEIDVRFNSSTSNYNSSSNPRDDINFFHIGVTDSYAYMLTQQETLADIYNIFNVLSYDYNLPATYHCSAGSDRTGLVSILVEGLLGVSNEDIFHDYELTTWYYSKRLRGDLIKDGDIYSFDPTGACDHGTWVSNVMYVMNGLLGGYDDGTGLLSHAVTKFLKTKVGLTDTLINKVKENLIELD